MQKFLIILGTVLFCIYAQATNKAAYKIVYELSEKGQKPKGATVIIEEGKQGIIKSTNEGSEETGFNVTVNSLADGKLSVDYKFKNSKGKKSFELAKTSVPFISGKAETNKFQDTNGSDLQLTITVTKN
jgi:hypothetical protein